jgi:putative membrane protein
MFRRHPVPTALAAVACAVTLCLAGPVAARAASGAVPVGSSSAVSGQDQSFLIAAHQSDLAEIAGGKAASSKAASSGVRDLATRLISDHTKLDAAVSQLASTHGVTLPSSPSPAQTAQLQKVSALSGQAFDSAFLSAQIAGHQATLAAVQKELSSGQASDVVAAARTARPVVVDHLSMAQKLSGSAGEPSSVNAGTGGQAAAMVGDRERTTLAATDVAALLLAAGVAGARQRRQRSAGSGFSRVADGRRR